ncbi:Calx-beta domain-containing protein [Paludisphaera mucosa]|uniref:Calx-beta domain-containing protein n=1 Tax=Paludisphaera mucosa TaxID=3030827 RepID=A0ABT6FIV3_9BACT|nr:Calx-beta domain-containing protein [Paludisphaera mucosa]MDG3007508.1 Calx-beta domain-containing protein [Paludisphaera mucosa]
MMLTHGRARRRSPRRWNLEALEDRRLMSVGDPTPSEIAFPPYAYHEVSEAAGAEPFTVVRTGDLSGPASVRVRTRGDFALDGYDYVGLDFVLTFAPGQSEADFAVAILDDAVAEPYYPKGFWVELSEPTGVDGLGVWSVASVHLIDDEPASTPALAFMDFGDAGLWTYNDASGYRKINDASPEAIVAAPTVAAYGAYLDFGESGLWAYDEVRGYRRLSDVDPEAMAIAPGSSFLAIDFGRGGLWTWSESSGWAHLNDVSPDAMVAETGGVFLDYGDQGLWEWNEIAGWAKLNDAAPETILGGGYFDYGAAGLWSWSRDPFSQSNVWTKLGDGRAEGVAVYDDRTYFDFGPKGVWSLDADSAWRKVSDSDPASMTASFDALYIDFGPGGVWRWGRYDLRPDLPDFWTRLSDAPAQAVVLVSMNDLLIDFGPGGLWRWSVKDGYAKLNAADPSAVAVV